MGKFVNDAENLPREVDDLVQRKETDMKTMGKFAWDADFVKVDNITLFHLINAANYLNIENLINLTCKTLAEMIMKKTPQEIMKIFNIETVSPEEEEEIRRENPWAFE
ncbi:hypothetical protein TSUD_129920 [Trifolium subterraneum]|uniref:SKP1 component dimerisation domain-containing protein n=1 Tax=Trifolium subterraneum TaxID=3900 RepID=A0A2Z6NWQ7_TRISU|nr:hypothetical protein TSUD_129920 [Trifolium subterraneum]